MAVQLGLEVWKDDFSTAFLQTSTEALEKAGRSKPILVKPPRVVGLPPGVWWLVNKPIYGLREAGRCWQLEIGTWLRETCGYDPTELDPNVFVLRDERGKVQSLIGLLVDDILAAGTPEWRDEFRAQLYKAWHVKESKAGSLTTDSPMVFGGIKWEVRVDERGHVGGYYGTPLAKSIDTLQEMLNARKKKGGKDDTNYAEYLTAIGMAMWIARTTRPDLLFDFSRVARREPTLQDYADLWRAVGRLTKTPKEGTFLPKLGNPGECTILAFGDAALTEAPKCRLGLLVGIYDGKHYSLLDWESKKSARVARSSTSGELQASTHANDAAWRYRFLYEEIMGIRVPISVVTDAENVCNLMMTNRLPREQGYTLRDLADLRRQFNEKSAEMRLGLATGKLMLADPLTKHTLSGTTDVLRQVMHDADLEQLMSGVTWISPTNNKEKRKEKEIDVML